MLDWDTCNGIARRCWSGHPYARIAIQRRMRQNEKLNVTLPYSVSDELDIPDS